MIHVDSQLFSCVWKLVLDTIRGLHLMDSTPSNQSFEVVVSFIPSPDFLIFLHHWFPQDRMELVRCDNEWYSSEEFFWVLLFLFQDQTLTFEC